MKLGGLTQEQRLDRVVVRPDTGLKEGMQQMDRGGLGVLLVVDSELDGKLLGLLTDGDIRRAILQGRSLDGPCLAVANKSPVVGRSDAEPGEALALLDHARSFPLDHLPLVDGRGSLVGLALRADFSEPEDLPLAALVMAGGFGTRLHPLTVDVPKPMLPVGDRPLIEDIVRHMGDAGIRSVSVSTHFQPEKIRAHLGDGEGFGVDITYLSEEQPLGTAGCLGLLDRPDGPLLVMNGDILTRVDYGAMLRFHRRHQALFTIGVRRYEYLLPYGVVDVQGPLVRGITEKPRLDFLVNAGIYLLEPQVLDFIRASSHLDMDELVTLLVQEQQTVVSFPIVEYWLDIGQFEHYEQAQSDMQDGRLAR